MDVIRQQQDDVNLSLWHFKIGGIAFDGAYRVADLSRETTTPADWLAANQTEAQSLIDNGVINEEVNQRLDFQTLEDQASTEIEWLNDTIPLIDSMTAAQVRSVVKRLAQENRQMIKAWRYVIRRLS